MSATIAATAPAAAPGSARPGEAAARRAMIDNQLRTNGVTDPAILRAIETVDRTAFTGGADAALAYTDRAVPLGNGRALNPPLTTARLIIDAAIAPGQHVLLIGAATGYAAAVLSAMGARVTAIESDAALAAAARAALSGDDGVTVVEAPLTSGAAETAPYDAMIIDGAVAAIPAALLAQVAPGGRIATGIVERGVARLARAVRIAEQDTVSPVVFADLECIVLPQFSPPPQFRF